MFHVYLIKREFHFLLLHINQNNPLFAFSLITDSQNGNLVHNYDTEPRNTHPSPLNDVKSYNACMRHENACKSVHLFSKF